MNVAPPFVKTAELAERETILAVRRASVENGWGTDGHCYQ
jgi:hypothetical protein